MPSFNVEPEYLSPEHARQVERFTGCPYDPEGTARGRAWAAFKLWERKQHLRARLIACLQAVRQERQQEPGPGAE